MKTQRFLKLIALVLSLCLSTAILASCVGESETTKETKQETEAESESKTESVSESATESETKAETESETKAETESETKAETESETKAETESETKAETESETEKETKADVNLTTQTVIDGFKAGEWEFTYTEVNMNGSTPPVDEGNPHPYIDDNGNVLAEGKSRFTFEWTGTETFDYGFRMTLRTNINTTVASQASYWASQYIVSVGDFAFVIQNAFHEYYNGSAPVILGLYEEHTIEEAGDTFVASGNPVAECYTDAWAHNGAINEDVNAYLNALWTIDYKNGTVTVTNDTFGDIEWELWDGTTSTEIEMDNAGVGVAGISIHKSWGGTVLGEDHVYFSDLVVEKYVPSEE